MAQRTGPGASWPAPGKIANVIVTMGDPLEIRTEMRYVFINGELIDMQNKHRLLYEKYRGR